MNKWSVIKQRILNKLSISEDESRQQGYLSKFQDFANECLDYIANSVKPKVKSYEIITTVKNSVAAMPDDFIGFSEHTNFLTMSVENYGNGYACEDGYDSVTQTVLMLDPMISYIDDKTIKLPQIGTYKIYYNALYPEISDTDIKDDAVLEIDPSVLNLLPSYVASQCLTEDNIQKSVRLQNEFELGLSRLDNGELFEVKHFRGIR